MSAVETRLAVLRDERLAAGRPVVLELGVGGARREPGSIGIDRLPGPAVDLVAELEQALASLPDRSVDRIHAHHVLEHLPDFTATLGEVWRVLKDEGSFLVSVPHFSNPYYYSDYTHRQPFGLYTFAYFMKPEDQPPRKVPNYGPGPRFRARSTRLMFRLPLKEWRPTLPGRALTWLFNRSPRAQEVYEAHLCHLLPCYEVRLDLIPVRD